jgi:excinuclease UvrABC nuclease subunit
MTEPEIRAEHRSIVKAAVPIQKTGVYFLIANKKIVYVGQSHNIPGRVAEHMLSKEFDSFAFVPAKKEELDSLERAYINKFLPVYNRDPTTEKLRKQAIPLVRKRKKG